MLCCGVMSGTSLDGVDACLVDIDGVGENTKIKLIEFVSIPIPNDTKARIKECCDDDTSSVSKICSLNFELGYLFSDAVKAVCELAHVKTSDLGFVATHGQTIWHDPDGLERYPSTMQIGESSVMAKELNCLIIDDFRPADIACGGQGAPLVPYSEKILYGSDTKNIGLVNIGGISNITVIPYGDCDKEIFAFDCGPGNMMIDQACLDLYDVKFDDEGKIAGSGVVVKELLDELKQDSYLSVVPPKSTGRERFGAFRVKDILKRYSACRPQDIITTFTYYTAFCITDSVNQFVLNKIEGNLDALYIGGGGAHNSVLIDYIDQMLPSCDVLTQESLGFSSDAKEAIAFCILGNQTLHHLTSNVPGATGAKDFALLGKFTYPTIKE